MVILRFLQSFLDIALWRKGPQDLPASTLLGDTGADRLHGHRLRAHAPVRPRPVHRAAVHLRRRADAGRLAVAGAGGFFGRRQRFVQTITATLGVGLLVLLPDVTFRSAQLSLGWSDELSDELADVARS